MTSDPSVASAAPRAEQGSASATYAPAQRAALPGNGSAGLPAATAGLSRRRRWAGACLLVVGLPVLTVVLVQYRDRLSYATPVLLMLTLVVGVAVVGGLWVALPAAVLGGLALNWFFTPPYGTLVVDQPAQLLVLLVYLGVAVAVSVIVDAAARRAAEATRARAEAQAISTLAGATLTEARTLPDLLERARETFGMREVSLLESTPKGEVVAARAGGGEPEVDEWVLRVPAAPGVVLAARGPSLFAEDRRVLASFAEAAGTALEGRRLARQAQAAAELQAADRMRTALLASVGHDLRTPLAGVKAAVSSLLQRDVQLSDGDRAELLDTIDTCADRLEALVANLLDASRLQAGALSVHLQTTRLPDVVAAVVAAVPSHLRARVTVELPPLLPDVSADPGLLERVLANLLDNALRHAPESPVLLRASAQAQRVTCDVVDHGLGVSPGQRDQLFAPFQRLDDRSPTGVGLGLAVARGFTEVMHGNLEPQTTPGGGLTMHLTLPSASAGSDGRAAVVGDRP